MEKESKVRIHGGQRYEKTEETVGGEGRGQRRKRKSGMMVVNPKAAGYFIYSNLLRHSVCFLCRPGMTNN